MGFFSWLFRTKKPKQIKLGLALGSGGAKGFAELGALKAFEENDIRFDVVAGTSIGSIIGAFYANGYSSVDVLELLRQVEVKEITNAFMMNMDTCGLFGAIDKALGSFKIEELKKPFFAVATHVESGTEKVFDSGSVATALCASCSMPPFFKPVIIDGERYIDGAFCNSIPADLVKNAGADYVVGIDLSTTSKPSIIQKFIPTFKSKVENPREKGYKYSDVMLHPDLNEYSATSFNAWHKMYDIGYMTAIEKIPQIKKELQKLKGE